MCCVPPMAASQAGSYPVFSVPSYDPVSYFGPVSSPITTITMPYASEGFIYPSSHSVLVTTPLIPGTQSQTEEISQMLSNITFSSPPISPQVTDNN